MWEDFELPLAVRMRLRKTRLYWRGRVGLKWFMVWTAALLIYLAIGLQPVEAKNYDISGQLSIPSISLTSDVAKLNLDNGELVTPENIVGSFSNHRNKTLLIGHSTGIFAALDSLKVDDELIYNGQSYHVTTISRLPKSLVNMRELLQSEEAETLVLMTCAGTTFPNGDATDRLVITAIKS